jgi:hypothetical protein
MLKKRDVVTNTTALNSMLTNMQIPLDGDVLLRSDEYDFPIVVWIPQNGGDDTQFLPFDWR